MQHLRQYFAQIVLKKLNKLKLLKASRGFTAYKRHQFICGELFPSFTLSPKPTSIKLHTRDQARVPLTAQKL